MRTLNDPYYRIRKNGEWLCTDTIEYMKFTHNLKDSVIFDVLSDIEEYFTQYNDYQLLTGNDIIGHEELEVCVFSSKEIASVKVDKDFKKKKERVFVIMRNFIG